ncbi:MAG: hypothetical protein J5793_03295, partial [Clostridia bacterium]|nr:hypothetical protein [Clostridia bacterium]
MRVSFGLFSPSAPRGCFAFPLESEIDFAFTVFGAKAKNVWIYVGNDEKVLFGREVPFVALEDGFSVEYKLNASELTGKDGLFFTHFEFEDVNGKRFYSATDENCDFYLSDRFVNEESFLVFNEIYESPEWFAGGVVYQIFPDRFAKGGKAVRKADAKYNDDWDHGTPEYPARAGDAYDNNTHFGGTLWGAAEKLDYLERLGVTCVYFNPVYKAFSNHKYDIGDYLQVDESFGGNEALRYFVKKAHEHGIAVILDGVFNHVGDDSVYFNKYG